MVSALLLATLAIGAAAVMFQTGGGIQVQGNRRTAIELANERMEIVRAQGHEAIRPIDFNSTHYLSDDGNDQGVLNAPVSNQVTEPFTLDGIVYELKTEVVRRPKPPDIDDADPFTVPFSESEYLQVTVTVRYGNGADDMVSLSTCLVPEEITAE